LLDAAHVHNINNFYSFIKKAFVMIVLTGVVVVGYIRTGLLYADYKARKFSYLRVTSHL